MPSAGTHESIDEMNTIFISSMHIVHKYKNKQKKITDKQSQEQHLGSHTGTFVIAAWKESTYFTILALWFSVGTMEIITKLEFRLELYIISWTR